MASINMGVGEFTSQRSNETDKTKEIAMFTHQISKDEGEKNPNTGKGAVRWDTHTFLVDTNINIIFLKAIW